MVVSAPLASKGKRQRCRQKDIASHNCNRYWIVGGYSKHETSHGPDRGKGLVAGQKSGKSCRFLWLPRSATHAEQVHILKAIHQTIWVNGPSPGKISDTCFHWGVAVRFEAPRGSLLWPQF